MADRSRRIGFVDSAKGTYNVTHSQLFIINKPTRQHILLGKPPVGDVMTRRSKVNELMAALLAQLPPVSYVEETLIRHLTE